MCHVSTLIFNFQFSIRYRRTNYILFIFKGVMCHVSTLIFNFQLSTFNSIETHQLHIVYSQRCNVSRLYINFQFSTFNFQLISCIASANSFNFSVLFSRALPTTIISAPASAIAAACSGVLIPPPTIRGTLTVFLTL